VIADDSVLTWLLTLAPARLTLYEVKYREWILYSKFPQSRTNMSFAILRHGKVKSTSTGVVNSHNHRGEGAGDKVNIDASKAHLNVFFDGDGAIDRARSKTPPKHRKDAVVGIEIMLSASPEFFDAIEKDREKLAKHPTFLEWVKKSVGWLKAEFGTNLVDTVLHMDESSPHLHSIVVPLTKDGRLCGKELMSRANLQRRQTEYAKAVDGFGLKRGDPAAETKRKHIGLKEKGDAGSGGATAKTIASLTTELEKSYGTIKRQQSLWNAECKKLDEDKKELKNNLLLMKKELVDSKSKLAETLTALKSSEIGVTELNVLKKQFAEQKKVVAELDKNLLLAKNELKNYQENDKKESEFWDKWKDAKMVVQVDGCPLVEVLGNKAVFSMGRDAFGIKNYKPGEVMPSLHQQTEKEKKGISR